MPQPPAYTRDFNFTQFSASYPLNQQPGVHLDAEFNGVKSTLDRTLANLALVQRDDGRLRNHAVGVSQLDSSVITLLKSVSQRMRGAWAPDTLYQAGDLVIESDVLYIAVSNHISAPAISVDANAGRMYATPTGSDDVLRSELESTFGAGMIGTLDGQTVQQKITALVASSTSFGIALSAQGDITDALDSRVTATEASISANYTTLAGAISAEASARLTLSATVTTNTSGITSLGSRMSTAEANITNNYTALAAVDTAEASARTALAARVTTAEGNISSQGTRLTTAEASITSEATARATADTALASDITTVSASVSLKTQTYRQTSAPGGSLNVGDQWYDTDDGNKQYVWTGTSWIDNSDGRFASLASGLSTVAASVTSEATARASADSAMASDITTVSTTVAGHTSTIASHATSINGLQANWNLTLDVDGYITGLYQQSTSTSSDFLIIIDNFKIKGPTGSHFTPFQVDTVNDLVKMTNVEVDTIKVHAVTSDAIAPAAVTNSEFYSGTNVYVASTSPTEGVPISGSITTTGGRVRVLATFITAIVSGGGRWFVKFYRDGTQMFEIPYLQNGNFPSAWPMLWIDDAPSAGSHTYDIKLHLDTGDSDVTFTYVSLELTEFKK